MELEVLLEEKKTETRASKSKLVNQSWIHCAQFLFVDINETVFIVMKLK